jgi:hypothetical protein
MKRNLVVEWMHIGKDVGHTCVRCGETGVSVMAVIGQLRPMLEEEGIPVKIIETVLPDERIDESNSILLNGVPLEKIIGGMSVTATPCTSCACITGDDNVECRAVTVDGTLYEAIPPELIARAVIRALELDDPASRYSLRKQGK